MRDAHARRPVDKKAALVISRGAHFVSAKQYGCLVSDTPPPSVPRPLAVPDLAGKRFGRMTVVAYCGRVKKQSSGGHFKTFFYWSVRCDCGKYSMRRHRSILRPTNDRDACEECRHLDFLKRRSAEGAPNA